MLDIRSLRKSFAFRGTAVRALDDVNLQVERGEFFVLLGPSGCGKTTMLRSIAGLERPDGGAIVIDGAAVFSGDGRVFVPPERRPIGMVFQSYAVWPHMDVYQNVAFPLREGVRRLDARTADARVREVLGLLGLSELADRPVTTLSGGQQQRVALARALALQPKVLLMDEPLSNLDFKLQLRLRAQLKALLHRLEMTTVYVTHNQAEAMELGDRIAVMNQGQLVQVGTPQDLYQKPRDEFVARFFGDMALLPARAVRIENGSAELEGGFGRFRGVAPAHDTLRTGDSCFLGIRPEDARIVPNGGTGGPRENIVKGTVDGGRFIGEGMLYTVRIGAFDLRVKVHHSVELAEGDPIVLHVPPQYCSAVPLSGSGDAYAGEEGLEAPDNTRRAAGG